MAWEQLLDIARESADADTTDLACPNDGEPLQAGPDGGLHCPYDGWRP